MNDTKATAAPVLTKRLDDLFRGHTRMLWGLAYRITRCAADADDIVQETFARAVTDGGGEYTALHGPLVGRSKVLTLHLRVAQRRAAGAQIEFRLINGLPAVIIHYASAQRRQAPRAVLRCELGPAGCIRELQTILASRKLTAVRF
jgi:hypothetical protein